jgi:hypothetical protein
VIVHVWTLCQVWEVCSWSGNVGVVVLVYSIGSGIVSLCDGRFIQAGYHVLSAAAALSPIWIP